MAGVALHDLEGAGEPDIPVPEGDIGDGLKRPQVGTLGLQQCQVELHGAQVLLNQAGLPDGVSGEPSEPVVVGKVLQDGQAAEIHAVHDESVLGNIVPGTHLAQEEAVDFPILQHPIQVIIQAGGIHSLVVQQPRQLVLGGEGELMEELDDFQRHHLVVLGQLQESLDQGVLGHGLGLAGLVLKALEILRVEVQLPALFFGDVSLFAHNILPFLFFISQIGDMSKEQQRSS